MFRQHPLFYAFESDSGEEYFNETVHQHTDKFKDISSTLKLHVPTCNTLLEIVNQYLAILHGSLFISFISIPLSLLGRARYAPLFTYLSYVLCFLPAVDKTFCIIAWTVIVNPLQPWCLFNLSIYSGKVCQEWFICPGT